MLGKKEVCVLCIQSELAENPARLLTGKQHMNKFSGCVGVLSKKLGRCSN